MHVVVAAETSYSVAYIVGTVFAWLVSIVLTGWMAQRKGRSVAGWSLLAAFIAIWAFVIVALLPSKRADDEPDQLEELRDLHDTGVLTDEEFEAKKTKVLTEAR